MNMINQEDNNQTKKNDCTQKSRFKHAPLRILVAEDDYEMRKMLLWYLQQNGCNVVECKDGNDLIKHLGFFGPLEYFLGFDLIISDIRMPGVTGTQVLDIAKEYEGFPPMILITAFPDEKTFDLAESLGAAAILPKPFDMDELFTLISQIFPLGLFREKDQLPLSRQDIDTVNFPLDLCFRHIPKMENIKAFVHKLVARLNRFDRHIINFRMVVDRSVSNYPKRNIYHVSINIKIPGKTIVLKHDSCMGSEHENLYLAIHIAFGTASRRLKQYLQKTEKKYHYPESSKGL